MHARMGRGRAGPFLRDFLPEYESDPRTNRTLLALGFGGTLPLSILRTAQAADDPYSTSIQAPKNRRTCSR